MKNNIVVFLIALLMITTAAAPVYAGNSGSSSHTSLPRKMVRKFSRGFVNIFTGMGEIIKQPLIEADQADSLIGIPAGCMSGFFMGIGWTFYRIGAGVFDIITFPLPINDYKTIIEPEFII